MVHFNTKIRRGNDQKSSQIRNFHEIEIYFQIQGHFDVQIDVTFGSIFHAHLNHQTVQQIHLQSNQNEITP